MTKNFRWLLSVHYSLFGCARTMDWLMTKCSEHQKAITFCASEDKFITKWIQLLHPWISVGVLFIVINGIFIIVITIIIIFFVSSTTSRTWGCRRNGEDFRSIVCSFNLLTDAAIIWGLFRKFLRPAYFPAKEGSYQKASNLATSAFASLQSSKTRNIHAVASIFIILEQERWRETVFISMFNNHRPEIRQRNGQTSVMSVIRDWKIQCHVVEDKTHKCHHLILFCFVLFCFSSNSEVWNTSDK